MKKRLFIALGLVGVGLSSLWAIPKHNKETAYPTYKGLVMAGYQGWFRAPQDGTNQGFGHYGTGKALQTEAKHVCSVRWTSRLRTYISNG